MPSGIDADTPYQLRINTLQLGMNVASAAGNDPDRDNDAVQSGDYAEIQLKTGRDALETERFWDFGLTTAIKPGENYASSDDLNLLVYPNPATDVARLRFRTWENNVTISVFEAGGRMIESQQVSARSGYSTIALDISHWASGSYIVRIQEAGNAKALSSVLFKH